MSVKHNETAERTVQPDSESILRSLQALHNCQERVVLLRSLKQQLFGDKARFSVDGKEYQINVRRGYQEQSARSRSRRGALAMPYYMFTVVMIPEERRPRKEDIVTAFTFDPYQAPEFNLALMDRIGGGADTPEHAADMGILYEGLAALGGTKAAYANQ